MSRLLESLRQAQQERLSKSAGAARSEDQSLTHRAPEPGYFWTSMFWLILVCGLIVGGFLLLQYQLHGIEPDKVFEKWISVL